MKRIISIVLAIVMLVCATVVSTSATGSVIFEDGFDKGFAPRNWLTDPNTCHFKYDSKFKCIFGYDSAKVLQSNFGTKYDKWWDKFYASFDFQVRGFDDLPEQEGRTHSVSMWYNDLMETGVALDDVDERGANYLFKIEIETGKAILEKSDKFSYVDDYGINQKGEIDGVIKEGNVNCTIETGDDAPWYEIGMRVTDGKIECYFNRQLVFSTSAEESTQKIGPMSVDSADATVGSEKSAILFINEGNYIALDNFRVMTPDYDFVDAPSVVYGDVNNDTDINIADVTTMLKMIAGWQNLNANEAAADVNLDEDVNLADVTMTLKSIAGWEGIVLGTKA